MEELYHHGILGQKWGKRNGPPYPLGGGDYSPAEKRAIYKKRKDRNSIYNKKHFDEVINKDKETLTTLSYDKDRTKDVDMFYATHNKLDKHQYNAMFNHKIPQEVKDENGNVIGKDYVLKYRIDNSLKSNIKVASEDSAAAGFRKLYSNDRDFYNFVTQPDRMESYFAKDRYKFRGYRESKHVLDKMKQPDYKPTERDIDTLYRMFNYVIPYDGMGNAREAKDMLTQRTKFFNEMKKQGYGAVLDTNDAIYGGYKAASPVIVFDMSQVVPSGVYNTTMRSKKFSSMVTVGRKALGV